ncbi:MAG: BlaI/MecI/CopY family transcriptional regulator [Acidobacteriota bacterium]
MKLSDAEWTVMHAVWERSPASARDVLEVTEPETGWAYTTVKTILDRLVDKGVLQVRKRANTGLYEPLLSRQDARRNAVRSLVDRAFDGAFGSFVQHLVSNERLSKRDRAELARLVQEAEADDSSPRGSRR